MRSLQQSRREGLAGDRTLLGIDFHSILDQTQTNRRAATVPSMPEQKRPSDGGGSKRMGALSQLDSVDPEHNTPCLGDALPRAKEAVIPVAKLCDYALNPDHPEGGPKARAFASVLGITGDSWEHLRDEMLRTLPTGRISRINANLFATTYGVRLVVRGLNGRDAPITTAWKLVGGIPHFVSARVDFKALSR